MVVRTKDADCLLSPRVRAVAAAIEIAEKLMDADWQFKKDEKWGQPGDRSTADQELPAVRWHPPGTRHGLSNS